MEYQEYELLHKNEKTYLNKPTALVEYDPTSNKPFMVYELNFETLEYESYSGEDTLDMAINVCDNLR